MRRVAQAHCTKPLCVLRVALAAAGRASAGDASEETPSASRPAGQQASPPSVTLRQKGVNDGSQPPTPDVRLYHRAVVVAQENTGATAPQPGPPASPTRTHMGILERGLQICSALRKRLTRRSS